MNKLTYTLFFIFISSILLSQTTPIDNSCAIEDCHESFFKKSIIHSPIINDCTTCHEKNNNGEHPDDKGPEFKLIDTGADLCETCHDIEKDKQVIHFPFDEGNCTECHSPHSSNQVALLKGNNQRETCEQCHDLDVVGNNFKHGPFVSNQCVSCHVGHQSNFESLLVDKVPALCFQCHQERVEDLNLQNIHPPFKKNCLNCHSPHTSPAAKMLLEGDNELCFKCHKTMKKEVNSAKVVHYPIKKQGQCVKCHSPHASKLTNLLVAEQPNLCIKCHSKNTNNKEKFIDIKSRMQKKYLHEPVSDGECVDCHLPHFSNNNFLLNAAFPKGNYTKPSVDSFELCFQCHDSEKITNKFTDSDTNFRDGKRNLHYVHVMKRKSISCQTCHDMHGAENEHLIGNVVYFGKWKMPIGYKVTETGGSCLPGCHVRRYYDREKD